MPFDPNSQELLDATMRSALLERRRLFELQWQKGCRPNLMTWIADLQGEPRWSLLSALVAIDIGFRARSGERIEVSDYADVLVGCETWMPLIIETIRDQVGEATELYIAPSMTGVDGSTWPVRIPPDYRIDAKIAEGGMGVVYRAFQFSSQRIVALKMIRSDRLLAIPVAEQHLWINRFRTEALAEAQLHHPNIPPVYQVGEVEGLPFYSMQFINGASLGELVAHRLLSDWQAAHYFEPICRAVQHAHELKILHRDIKPGNILIDFLGHPFLIDFGLATGSGTKAWPSQSRGVVGTFAYMSPEQALDPNNLTPASDIYSLGATLYFALTGHPPFCGLTLPELLKGVQHDPPIPARDLNPQVSLALDRIINRCLQFDPLSRYASARELANELYRFCHAAELKIKPNEAWQRLRIWQRHPNLIGMLYALQPRTFLDLSRPNQP